VLDHLDRWSDWKRINEDEEKWIELLVERYQIMVLSNLIIQNAFHIMMYCILSLTVGKTRSIPHEC